MKLAYAAGRAGGTMTGVMSAANEQVGRARQPGGAACSSGRHLHGWRRHAPCRALPCTCLLASI